LRENEFPGTFTPPPDAKFELTVIIEHNDTRRAVLEDINVTRGITLYVPDLRKLIISVTLIRTDIKTYIEINR